MAFLVQVPLKRRQLAADLETAYEVDKVTTRTDCDLVDDDKVALADCLVGMPAPVRACVAAGGNNDVINEIEAFLVQVLIDLRSNVCLGHPWLKPFVLDLP